MEINLEKRVGEKITVFIQLNEEEKNEIKKRSDREREREREKERDN